MYRIKQTHHIRHFIELLAVLALLGGGIGIYHHVHTADAPQPISRQAGQQKPKSNRNQQPKQQQQKPSQPKQKNAQKPKVSNGTKSKFKHLWFKGIIIFGIIMCFWGVFQDYDDGGGRH